MPPLKKLNLAILISGRGSNLQAIIDACEREEIPARIDIVISNKKGAQGLKRAEKHCIPTAVVSNNSHTENEIEKVLDEHKPDLICLAGFMKILSPSFVSKYRGKIINIHPSLLPKFCGLHAQAQALAAGEKESGATVHFVSEEVDSGPIIVQRRVPILEGDTVEALSERILRLEHQVYPEAIAKIASERLKKSE